MWSVALQASERSELPLGDGATPTSAAAHPQRTVEWLNKKFGIDDSILNSQKELQTAVQGAAQAAQATGTAPELMKTAVQGGIKVFQ